MNLQSWIVVFAWISGIVASQLNELAFNSPNYIIPIHDSNIEIVAGARDYYTLVLLTSTDERHGCGVCEVMSKVVEKVSRAWFNTNGESGNLYFINIDIVDATNLPIFETLQLGTVPHCWLIPPTPEDEDLDSNQENSQENSDPLQIFKQSHYKFKLPQASFDEQVELFAKFLRELTGKPVHFPAEDQLYQFARAFIVVFLIIVGIKKLGKRQLQALPKKHIYTVFLLGLTLIFLGGYQFTMNHAVPFVAKNDDGLIIISGGMHYQFGIEIILSALNYAGLAASLICLIYIGQYRITPDSKIQSESVKTFLILGNNLVLFLLYSSLTSMILRKDHEYAYGFAKLF